ncbi:WD40 repeat domain-containing protein [Nocardia sp. NPDC058114]|uniref:WD40 repeat domain-containing protein n=1 Tax=Nocardia sp. NPDC058114 TaxID=3346346 RepID=UPI0036DF0856
MTATSRRIPDTAADVYVFTGRDDETTAGTLIRGLRRLAPARERRNSLNVVRGPGDRDGREPNGSAHPLTTARYFLLLGSPSSAQSATVGPLVEYWRTHRTSNTLLIAVTSGDVQWDRAASDFVWGRTTALPRSLSGYFAQEPLWVDLRETVVSTRDPEFISKTATLAAAIRGCTKEELFSENVRHHRRLAIVRNSALAVIALLTVLALVLFLVFFEQRGTAQYQRDLVTSRQLIAQSRNLAVSDPRLSRLLAVAARRIAPAPERANAAAALSSINMSPRLHVLHTERTWSVTFSPDGRTLAAGGGDGTVRILDLAHGAPRTRSWTGHTQGVNDLAYSRDGRLLASAGADMTVRIWDVAAGTMRGQPLTGHTDNVTALSFSPDGRRLASVSEDRTLRMWDVESGAASGPPSSFDHELLEVAFAPDGRHIAIGDDTSTARLIDESGATIGTPLAMDGGIVTSLAFSPDGRTLACSSSLARTRFWDLTTGQRTGPRIQETPWTSAVAYLGNELLASAGAPGTIQLWDTRTGHRRGPQLQGHFGMIDDLTASPDGTMLASVGTDHTIRMWDATPTTEILGDAPDADNDAERIVLGPNDRTLVVLGRYGSITRWDTSTGKHRQIGPPEVRFECLTADSDGTRYATADRAGRVHLWQGDLIEREDAELDVLTDDRCALAYSPDGSMLAIGGRGPSITVWDTRSRTKRAELTANGARIVEALAISPDNHTLVVADAENHLVLWNIESGSPRATLTGHTNIVQAIAFSPDGEILATGSADRSTRLWDVATGDLVGEPLKGTSTSVGALAFSPDGTLLAASSDTTVLWDIATAQKIGDPLTGSEGVSFDRSGRHLFTSNGEQGPLARNLGVLAEDQVAVACRTARWDLLAAERSRHLAGYDELAVCP